MSQPRPSLDDSRCSKPYRPRTVFTCARAEGHAPCVVGRVRPCRPREAAKQNGKAARDIHRTGIPRTSLSLPASSELRTSSKEVDVSSSAAVDAVPPNKENIAIAKPRRMTPITAPNRTTSFSMRNRTCPRTACSSRRSTFSKLPAYIPPWQLEYNARSIC